MEEKKQPQIFCKRCLYANKTQTQLEQHMATYVKREIFTISCINPIREQNNDWFMTVVLFSTDLCESECLNTPVADPIEKTPFAIKTTVKCYNLVKKL